MWLDKLNKLMHPDGEGQLDEKFTDPDDWFRRLGLDSNPTALMPNRALYKSLERLQDKSGDDWDTWRLK